MPTAGIPLRLICLLVVCLPAAAAERDPAELPQVVPVDGEPFEARLSAIDARWQMTFRTAGQPFRVLAARDVVRWGRCVEPRRGPLLLLRCGSLLVADVLECDAETCTADADLFGLVRLPRERLAGAIFRLPDDARDRARLLDRAGSAAGESDSVILTNGDEIAGRFGAIGQNGLSLETSVGPLEISLHRVRAVLFKAASVRAVTPEGLRTVAGFADGSRLVAEQLVVDGESLEITVAGGLVYSGRTEDLVYILPLGGRVTYLSDLTADDYRHVPYLELPWPYRTDRNVRGGPLRAGGRFYLKGLGMHSASRLTYLLSEPYSRFETELAIDDHTQGRGSVQFRIFVDGNQKYASQTLRGGSPPVPISVDLTGAKRLDLIVDYADRADQLDHADWLGARLIR